MTLREASGGWRLDGRPRWGEGANHFPQPPHECACLRRVKSLTVRPSRRASKQPGLLRCGDPGFCQRADLRADVLRSGCGHFACPHRRAESVSTMFAA